MVKYQWMIVKAQPELVTGVNNEAKCREAQPDLQITPCQAATNDWLKYFIFVAKDKKSRDLIPIII